MSPIFGVWYISEEIAPELYLSHFIQGTPTKFKTTSFKSKVKNLADFCQNFQFTKKSLEFCLKACSLIFEILLFIYLHIQNLQNQLKQHLVFCVKLQFLPLKIVFHLKVVLQKRSSPIKVLLPLKVVFHSRLFSIKRLSSIEVFAVSAFWIGPPSPLTC